MVLLVFNCLRFGLSVLGRSRHPLWFDERFLVLVLVVLLSLLRFVRVALVLAISALKLLDLRF